jgi:hypothetical protein
MGGSQWYLKVYVESAIGHRNRNALCRPPAHIDGSSGVTKAKCTSGVLLFVVGIGIAVVIILRCFTLEVYVLIVQFG